MAYSTITKSKVHMNTVLYTGDGNSTKAISGIGFQPDWIWLKNRTDAHWHTLTDVVRGTAKTLGTNTNSAEVSNATSGYVSTFGTDGFTVTEGSSNKEEVNTSSDNYVAWNWKTSNSQGSSNTDGSINTTYTSVNSTSKFSISKYVGTGSAATVGHGLGVVPKMIIIKDLSANTDWTVYHAELGNTVREGLNRRRETEDDASFFNDTSPTSSVFSIGSSSAVNLSGRNYIAYSFGDVVGYQKSGFYVGNNNNSFIYTGFKPQFLIIKNSTEANGWLVLDSTRTKSNPMGAYIYANNANAEGTVSYVDFYSTGFGLRGTSSVAVNKSGNAFIYYAVGQTLVGSNKVCATAY